MKRRDFVTTLGAGAIAAGVGACARETEVASQAVADAQTFRWKMVTTWPPNFPGLGTGANYLAETITAMSGGRLKVKVYGAGELVPAFEIFDAVSQGTAEMGHGAAYYWKGKSEAAQFFAAVPFGMNAAEIEAWMYHGGGLDLWREVYDPFNLVPFPAGHTGVQMGGWFNREINSVDDLKGLKMRIPGLGGEVLRRAGGTPVSLPGAEIFTSLQTGNIDATEWVGPYNDLSFGLYKAAQYYYYPGWHEPNTVLECMINKDAWNSLPDDLKSVVEVACKASATHMLSEFNARNHDALRVLVDEHRVDLRPFPAEVLSRLRELSTEVLDELGASDPKAGEIYAAYRDFQNRVGSWMDISEKAYFLA